MSLPPQDTAPAAVDTEPTGSVRRPEAPLPAGIASFLVFLSSGAVLVLETVALRLVGPYLGVTLQVTSAVIALALAAIAYGAWGGGRLADRRNPRPLIPAMLVLAGAATAFTLPVVRYAGELLRGGSPGAILLLTALAVFPPAALLAAVTPLVVKLQLADLRHTGRVVGRLSGIGTLGGITATLVTGFVLVAALPSSVIVVALAVLLGLTGLVLGWYQHRTDGGPTGGHGPGSRRLRGVRAGLGVFVLVAAGSTAVVPDPCDVETAYHCARVEADPTRPTGRTLWLNSAQHSYVDLADPSHLEYAYTRWFGAVADVSGPPGQRLDVLHLGGGGFTMPRYLTATRPGSANLVFEIDAGLVALDRRRLDVHEGAGLRTVVGDARVLLGAEPTDSRDLVVGDAFGHLAVPWHLTTREMVAQVRRVLRPGGTYVLNVIDYPPLRFVRAELATVAAGFAHVALVTTPAAAEGRAGANFVLVASDAPLPLGGLRERLATDPEPVALLVAGPLARFVGGARVLIDDHAPVDQMLAR